MSSKHPWEILPDLVDSEIITKEQANGIVLAHETANRRALQEIYALLPELRATDDITQRGFEKIRTVVQRSIQRESPDVLG